MALPPNLDEPTEQAPRRRRRAADLRRPPELRALKEPGRMPATNDDGQPRDPLDPDRASPRARTDKETDPQRRARILADALERFKIASEVEHDQRLREKEDLEFDRALPEDHWPEAIAYSRRGDASTGAQPRPMLTIPMLDLPVQGIINEARNSRLAIEIKPRSDGANEDGAELRQGMIRAIEVNSRASIGRNWAFERAVKCGRGVYRVLTAYANDGDFDLDIVIARIKNQGSVYLDPFASEPDWSDGEWAFVVQNMPRSEVQRRYGELSALQVSPDVDSVAFSSATDLERTWVDKDTVRVAEYFYVEHETRWLVLDEQTGEKQLLKPGQTPPKGQRARKVDVRQVKWCLITAFDIIDEMDWPGRFIPLIPVIGKEFNVDGEPVYKGVISNAKDAQRSYNYFRSAQVETVALAKSAPWVMAEGQDEGFEQEWDEVHTVNRTRIYYKPTTYEGHLTPAPRREIAEPPIQAITMLTAQADDDIKATTGRFAPSLGNLDPQTRSGKAIRELKQQGEVGSSNYIANLAEISMNLEGRILLDLLPHVYDRAGRIVRLLGEEPDDEREVILGRPFLETPNGPQEVPLDEQGQPLMPAPAGPPQGPPRPPMAAAAGPPMPGMPPPGAPGQPPGMPGMPPGMAMPKPPPKPKTYDLTKGQYAVVVSVGPGFQTQKEENLSVIETLVEAAPQLVAPVVMDLYADMMQGPMGKKLAKRFRRLNPQLSEDGEESLPPQVQQQMQQMQQALQQMQQAIQTDQIKLQAQQAIEQMILEAKAAIEREKIAAQVEIARIKADVEIAKTTATTQSRETVATLDNRTDLVEQTREHQHERVMHRAEIAAGDHAAARDDVATARGGMRDEQRADREAARDAQLDAATRPPEPPTPST